MAIFLATTSTHHYSETEENYLSFALKLTGKLIAKLVVKLVSKINRQINLFFVPMETRL